MPQRNIPEQPGVPLKFPPIRQASAKRATTTAQHPVKQSGYERNPEDVDSFYQPRPDNTSAVRLDTRSQSVAKSSRRDVVVYKGELYYKAPTRTRQQRAPQSPTQATPRSHWLFSVGIVLLLMVGGWGVFSVLFGWGKTTLDDIRYGRPRTFQIDAVVGHNDTPQHPTHFVAVNLSNKIQVIEFPGGDSTHAKTYIIPIGQGQELTPVTLSFRDVNGDGKLDMLITFGTTQVIFINDNGEFRPQRPGEQITL